MEYKLVSISTSQMCSSKSWPVALDGAPITIISFNRPVYLKMVLDSLMSQIPLIDESRIHLFQDGARSSSNGGSINEQAAVEECVRVFRKAVPNGTVHHAFCNLGIAFNCDRAERFVFEGLNADVGYFFEDDMVLSPYYIDMLARLARLALDNDRIGYVAAYGNHLPDPKNKHLVKNKLVQMHHLWGYALTKRHWQQQRPILNDYLMFLEGRSYDARPVNIIQEYFATLGLPLFATSQDAAKQLATIKLGAVRVMCSPCFGHYIGETGVHFTPALYDAYGFGKTEFSDTLVDEFDPLSVQEIDAFLAADTLVAIQGAANSFTEMVRDRNPEAKDQNFLLRHFVTVMYQGLLLRDPDPHGLESFVEAMKSGALTEVQVIKEILCSPEFAGAFVLLQSSNL